MQRLVSWNQKFEDVKTQVNLNAEISDSLSLISALVSANVVVDVCLPEEPSWIEANPGQVSQIMINLCANSEHTMRETGGKLTIQLTNEQPPSDNDEKTPELVCLTISDDGAGIPSDIQHRVCDPFFTTKETGSGIGLSTVYGIVDSIGGKMYNSSLPGKGTQIQMLFPRIVVDAESSHDLPVDNQNCAALNVLLVEENEAIVAGMTAQLTSVGHQVTSTTSSERALQMFRESPDRFDLLISDQTMPGMTGHQLISAVRQRRPDFPTILLTGFSHMVDQDSAQKYGIDVYCSKPITTSDLLSAIDQAIGVKADQA